MSTRLDFLSAIASILALWIAFDAGYRPYRIDILRNRLFGLRSELFELARLGRLGARGFRDPAYLRIRDGLNGFIRYGHQFTLFRLFVLLWSSKWWLDSRRSEKQHRSLIEAISRHSCPSREDLMSIMREAEYAIVVHMVSVNVIGFVSLRIGECAARVLRVQRGLRDKLAELVEENRRLLAPLEEDATRRLDREERRSTA
jgi:hypothetical protein